MVEREFLAAEKDGRCAEILRRMFLRFSIGLRTSGRETIAVLRECKLQNYNCVVTSTSRVKFEWLKLWSCDVLRMRDGVMRMCDLEMDFSCHDSPLEFVLR
jgi:hypothetical protein